MAKGSHRRLITVFSLVLIIQLFLGFKRVDSLEPQQWLVINHHPEILKKLSKHSTIHSSRGRILTVVLDKPFYLLSREEQQSIRRLDYRQVYQRLIPRSQDNPRGSSNRSLFVQADYQEDVRYLENLGPRDVYGLARNKASGNELAQQWFFDQFQKNGLEPVKQCYRDRDYGQECNIVGTRRGVGHSGSMVVVIGHLDDVGRSKAGTDDNATGAAALVSLAKALKKFELKHDVVFVASNGEETGLHGSRAFVNELKKSGQVDRVVFVINMDMIGYNQNKIVDIETNMEFQDQADWYAEMVLSHTSLQPNITMPAWGSDHVPFLNASIPTVLTIEHWETKTPCYHQACDKSGTLNWDYALEILNLNLEVILSKAERLEPIHEQVVGNKLWPKHS